MLADEEVVETETEVGEDTSTDQDNAAESTEETKAESEEDIGEGEEKGEEKGEKEEAEALPWRLQQAADRLGYTQEDVDALGDKAEATLGKLADSLDAVSTEFASMGRDALGVPKEEAKSGDVKPAVEQQKPSGEPFKLSVDAELFGDETVNQLVKPIEGQFSAMGVRLESIEAFLQESAQQQLVTQSNAFFSGLGDGYSEFIGKGPTAELERGSPEAKVRDDVLDMAETIAAGSKARDRAMTFDDAMQRALSIVGKDFHGTMERKKLESTVKKRTTQLISRPTSRRTAEKFDSPDKKAMAAYTEELKRKGISPEDWGE